MLKFNFSVFGVPLYFHWSTLIFLLLIVLKVGIFFGTGLFILSTISLLVHEYAHVYAALRLNVETKYVVTMAYGAAAMMNEQDISSRRSNEAIIAAAGPIASLTLGAISYFLYWLTLSKIFVYMTALNVSMGIFNMLPLYPMDGGRILRSLLNYKYGDFKSVKISVIITYILGAVGIAFFIYKRMFWMTFVFGIVMYMAYKQYQLYKEKHGYC